MKNRFNLLSSLILLLSVAVLVNGCTKPNEGLTYYINSSVFKYTASVQLTDPTISSVLADAVPKGLTLTLKGADAASIYDFSGFKALKINGGVVTVGLDPSIDLSGGRVVTFTILAEAPGYRDENISFTFSSSTPANQPLRVRNMLNLANLQPGVTVSNATTPVTGGVVGAPIIATTPVSGTATQTATVAIPAGTQLRDVSGALVNTGSETLTVVNLDVEKPSSVQYLPNQDLIQPVSVGGVLQDVAFSPAGITTVEMTAANGTEIRNFSQPITVTMNLDPTTINPATNLPIAAGDPIDFYSYDASKDLWSYESSGVVQTNAGKLFATLSVTHLTTFLCSVKGKSPCANPITVSFAGSAYLPPVGSTDNYKIRVYYVKGTKQYDVLTTYLAINSGPNNNIVLKKVPQGSYTVEVSKGSTIVGAGNFSGCQPTGSINLSIAAPTVNTPTMTILITGVCADPTKKIKIGSNCPAGTEVFYRQAGVGNYVSLGTVNASGALVTNLLDKTKSYDFTAYISQIAWQKSYLNVSIQGNTVVGTNGTVGGIGHVLDTNVAFSQDLLSGTITCTYEVNPIHCQ